MNVTAVAFRPDGKTLATADSGSIYLWDLGTKRWIAGPGGGNVSSVAFSPDGKTLATAGNAGGSTYLWDARTGRLIASLPASGVNASASVNTVAFSPDGKTLAVENADRTIYLWDVG
jgi:WD40 repeat protein